MVVFLLRLFLDTPERKTPMNNIQAININDAISSRLLATKYPKTTSEIVELIITTIPDFEKDGPVVTTVYLYDGEPVSLKEYLSQIPN